MHNESKTRCLYFSDRIISAMKSVVDYPLTIIEAPMGYGKTTAIKTLLTQTDATVLWQKIHDNSLTNFWNTFSELFSKHDVQLSRRLKDLGVPTDSLMLEASLNIIDSMNFENKTILVLDDYHLIQNEVLDKMIAYLVESDIYNLSIILSVRFTEFNRLEEFKLKGYLMFITKETFEFNPEEIRAYFKLCGKPLNLEKATQLYTYTEGWISALYLLMLNFESEDNDYDTTDIYSLMDKVVFKPLDEKSKDLLLSMCIFEGFTAQQAQEIWGRDNAESRINLLVSKNAFITYDAKEKKYDLHSILRSFLEDELHKKAPEYKRKLYKAASWWTHTQGQYLLSMHFSDLASDFESLMKSIEIDKGHSINSDHKDLIIKYVEKCPLEIKAKFPFAMLIYLRRMFTFNETELFKKASQEFMINLQKVNDVPKTYVNKLLGEYYLIMSFSGYNDIEKMSEFHQKSCALLNEPSEIMDNKASWTFGSPSVLYMFHRKSGSLLAEVATIKKAMPFYYELTEGHGSGAEYMMAAEHYYFTGNFEDAEIEVHRVLQLASAIQQNGIIICALFLQIKLAFMRADFQRIQALFNEIRTLVNEKNLYLFMHTLDMCEAQFYSNIHVKRLIPAWISKGELTNTRLFFPTMPYLNLVYGRVLLINEEYLKLIGIADHFMKLANIFPNLLAQIYTQIYLAAAYKQIFRQTEALSALKVALEMALPDKILMPFVENADYVKSLLEELHIQGLYPLEIEEILGIYKTYQKSTKHIVREYFTEDKPVLTERELEIALLAAKGLSNKEISSKLFISTNTVKTQLKNIFEKLGIHSRSLLSPYFEEQQIIKSI
ncbi:LuxR C-terminal-related transcriptional regulator [Fusibacter ferrireducens]|uniref:Helix-turn-helix transcriptional regulator n=1 Tax=Fusibacter ferrireducens TaxID=2785058 RepID=A0ABR9ZNB7_9FIRM|nr:LuxR C-terminal-related transcriptional regulator [Fusibacter ferrireducens]MBF4691960.1 helix-turn-helix transcriptional regulator [Fusibacter ferrireducens]